MSTQPPPSCKADGSTFHTDGYPSILLPVRHCRAEEYVGLCHHVCKVCPVQGPERERGHFRCRIWDGYSSGWWSLRASHWRAHRLPTGGGLACVVAVFVPAAPLWCDLFLEEDRRAGLGVDGGECRGGVDYPNGGLGNSPSGGKKSKGDNKSLLILFKNKSRLCARVAHREPHPEQQ